MDSRIIASIFLCLLPQIIITQDFNRHKGKGRAVEVNPENILYYSEEDYNRLVRQTTVFNNRPATPVVPYGQPASAPVVAPNDQINQQNAIVYPEGNVNYNRRPGIAGIAQSIAQRPLAGYPFRYQGLQTTTSTTPLIKVPLAQNEGTLLRPVQNEVLPVKPLRQQPRPVAQPGNQSPVASPANQSPIAMEDDQPLPESVPLTSDFDRSTMAIVNFGLNLIKAADKYKGPGGNIVVSPYSIATTLALIQQGAYEETQRQISNALQMSPENSSMVFRKFIDAIRKRASRNILRVATNVYIAPSFTLNPEFKRTAIHNFNSDITPLDFNRPDLAAQTINNWVAHKTDFKIDKLLSPDSIGQNTQIVLVNAVYFKGLWKTTFDVQGTETKDFTMTNGLKKPVPFMKMRKHFKSGVDFNIKSQILYLPFEGDLYSLMLVLPAEGTKLDDVVQGLQGYQLLAYQNLPVKEVQIEIPRFTIKADTDLSPVLSDMGVTNMFNQNSELFGIGNYQNYSAIVSSAKHTAVLSIDEKGGSAAAATAFAVVALSYEDPSDYFRANRPFLAVLWNNELAAPMFMAKVEDPTL